MIVRSIRSIIMSSCVALAVAGCPGKKHGTDPRMASNTGTNTAAKGPWRVLVQSGAKWTLLGWAPEGSPTRPRLTCEVTSVHTVGDAQIADLKWWHYWEDGDEEFSSYGLPTRVAVTGRGIWFVDGLDDAAIASALSKPPTHPDPPVEIPDMTRDDGKYVRVQVGADETVVCVGDGPTPGAGDCEDVCYGEMCVSSAHGLVSVEGTYAPGYSMFSVEGQDTE